MTSREMSCELGSDHSSFVIDGASPAHESKPALVENTLLRWWPDTVSELDESAFERAGVARGQLIASDTTWQQAAQRMLEALNSPQET